MKKQLNSFLCCGLVSILSISNSFAQTVNLKQFEPVLISGTNTKVHENVLTEFYKNFAEAKNVRWLKHDDKHFIAKFSTGDLEHSALLNRKGHLIYDISYGKEKHLPVDIRKEVKRRYVEYTISSATKVLEANRTIWVISVEDDANLAMVRVENDEMEEVRKYKKSIPLTKSEAGIVKQ